MRSSSLFVALPGLVVASALWGAGCSTAAPTDVPRSDAPRADVPGAAFTRTPDLSAGGTYTFAAADDVLAPNTDYAMVLETSVGRIVIDLYEEDTPVAANSFVFLARHHFFDGVAFHRVIDGFMAQGGDPNTLSADRSRWGYGGAGYQYAVESVPGHTFDHPGVVATANAGRTTNSSQFFITFAPATFLPPTDYTIFGEVIEGLDLLPSIVRGEPPATPTVIESAYILERPR